MASPSLQKAGSDRDTGSADYLETYAAQEVVIRYIRELQRKASAFDAMQNVAAQVFK